MGFFDFLKTKTGRDEELEGIMKELEALLQKNEVRDALIRSETLGTVGVDQMHYIKQVNELVYKLCELTGKTPEEIFSDPKNLKRKKEAKVTGEKEIWLNSLIKWANDNNLPELKIEEHHIIAGGYHEGFPRDKNVLIKLHTLNLPDCNLRELPKEIGNLNQLKKIWLKGNNLIKLPDEVCSLNLLEELYLPDNNIERLPEDIGNLSNLVEINFKNNNIKYLPVSMILLENLHKIDFRSQKHGKKISTPDIASLILHGAFDNNSAFRKKMAMLDDDAWNNLKDQLRNEYQDDIRVSIEGESIPYLTAIEEIYGKKIANSQLTSNFFNIGKF